MPDDDEAEALDDIEDELEELFPGDAVSWVRDRSRPAHVSLVCRPTTRSAPR